MKNLLLISAFCLTVSAFGQSTLITPGNSQPNILATSTTSGILPSQMTSNQRDAIANPAFGLMIFNTTSNCIEIYRSGGWFNLCSQSYTSNHINKLLGGNQSEYATNIKQTSDGGYILAGYCFSSANGDVSGTNHGNSDFWIVKLDASGNITWNKLLGGSGTEYAYSIQPTSDGGYIVAGTSSSSANGDVTGVSHGYTDFWVVKLDASGNITWNKLLGGNGDDQPRCIQQTTDGGYIIAGTSYSSASDDVTGTNHSANGDYWVVKLDASGNITWNKLIGGNADDTVQWIQQTTDGGYIVAGSAYSSNNGDVSGVSHGGSDYWIVKLDASGTITWNVLLGGSGNDYAYCIQQTTDGGYIVAGDAYSSATGNVSGTNHGDSDNWIVKLDASGAITWNKLLGGNQLDFDNQIQQTSDGGYILCCPTLSSANGDVSGTNHGNFDYWVVKLDGAGNILWNKLLGGSGQERVSSIQQTSDGNYIVSGYSISSANGDVTGVNHGNNDIWIIKLDPNGNIY